MPEKSTKGRDLAYKIATRLRGNEFKDMTLGEIDEFRAEMALFFDLKKRTRCHSSPTEYPHTVYPDQPAEDFNEWTANFTRQEVMPATSTSIKTSSTTLGLDLL